DPPALDRVEIDGERGLDPGAQRQEIVETSTLHRRDGKARGRHGLAVGRGHEGVEKDGERDDAKRGEAELHAAAEPLAFDDSVHAAAADRAFALADTEIEHAHRPWPATLVDEPAAGNCPFPDTNCPPPNIGPALRKRHRHQREEPGENEAGGKGQHFECPHRPAPSMIASPAPHPSMSRAKAWAARKSADFPGSRPARHGSPLSACGRWRPPADAAGTLLVRNVSTRTRRHA